MSHAGMPWFTLSYDLSGTACSILLQNIVKAVMSKVKSCQSWDLHGFIAKTQGKTEIRKKFAFFFELWSSSSDSEKIRILNIVGRYLACAHLLHPIYCKLKHNFTKFSMLNGHMIKCLSTDFGWARQENIWLLIMMHKLLCACSWSHGPVPNVFLFSPSTWCSCSKMILDQTYNC